MENTMRLEYSSSLIDLVEANPSFDKAKLRIAYTGKNRNRSFISKEAFEKAIPSIYGCPIVAHYTVEDNSIGAHDIDFVDTEDGKVRLINLTEPVGFVPQDAHWQWENVTENNIIHQYLTTEVVLWKRQAAYEKIKTDGITKQSMEITVNNGEMKDDYYEIDDFYFTAFCLLGEDSTPCFESASLLSFQDNEEEIKNQFTQMYEEFKLAVTANENYKPKEVDEKKMDKLQELLEKYNLTQEALPFEVENLTDEELEAKFEQFDKESKFALNQQLRSKLAGYIHDIERIKDAYDEDWEYPRYYFVDFDVDVCEVYFEDAKDNYQLYGATYVVSGDDVSVDMSTIKKKKYAIVDYEEGDIVFTHSEMISEITKPLKEMHETVMSKYTEMLKKEDLKQKEQLFERFESKLSGNPQFQDLQNECEQYSIDELENQLFALVGRKQFTLTSTTHKSPKAPAFNYSKKEESEAEPYGDLFDFMNK